MTGVMWFRRDLRLADNPAWSDVTSRFDRVVPMYVLDPRLWRPASAARRAMLAGCLSALDAALAERGGRLHVVEGPPEDLVPEVVSSLGAAGVVANADVSPYSTARDGRVAARVALDHHHGGLVHPPGSVLTRQGFPFRVFTPFYRAWADRPLDPWPVGGEAELSGDPGAGLPDAGPPPLAAGEQAAMHRLEEFAGRVDRYAAERDRPDLDTTSRISIDLKYGTIAARRVYDVIGTGNESRRAFVRQLAWRDFHAHLMAAVPSLARMSMRPEYGRVAWIDDPEGLEAWKRGQTGYPIVDAGMRQLRAEGWMHNRVRMLTASFLVKDLLIDWREGERHFRHLLLDADPAQNAGNWQWVAGTGTDAAPYFRIFNPVTQSKKFDPRGDYIRRWVPELAGLEASSVHAPWEGAPLELAAAGVVLGETYPAPIVDHSVARERTLAAYAAAAR